jgi:hypothetical protein
VSCAARDERALTCAGEAVRQLVREHVGLYLVVRLEVGRGNPYPEAALAVLPRGEIAEQRQERANLAAGE